MLHHLTVICRSLVVISSGCILICFPKIDPVTNGKNFGESLRLTLKKWGITNHNILFTYIY